MNYDLIRPCPKCPFRTDGEGYLRPERAQEIATAIARGSTFACHQTTVYVEDDEGGDMEATSDSQFCAGALIMMERMEAPNQSMRIAERLGVYDPSKLDMSAPVGNVLDFQRRHSEEDELPCCHISDMGCEAPAGYMEDGVPVSNVVEFEIPECEGCGEPTCEQCGSLVATSKGRDQFLCPYCQEGFDD